MPIKKFRSIEEMPDEVWLEPGSPELREAIRLTWARSARLAPMRYPPGVYRHRSLEGAQRQREAWDRENAERLRQRILDHDRE